MDTFGDIDGVLQFPDIVQEYSELVTAEARDRVARTETLRQQLSHGNKELVTHRMTEAVIDDLKPVHVKEKDCIEFVGASRRYGDTVLKAIKEERPVRQPRQGIVKSIKHQLLFH